MIGWLIIAGITAFICSENDSNSTSMSLETLLGLTLIAWVVRDCVRELGWFRGLLTFGELVAVIAVALTIFSLASEVSL